MRCAVTDAIDLTANNTTRISMHTLRVPLTAAVLLFIAAGACALDIVIEGQPACTMIIPDDPVPAVRYAADELQYHLRRATGAAIPIVAERDADPNAAAIVLGPCRGTKRAGVTLNGIGPNGFRIRRIGASLFILGRDNTATPIRSGGICVGPIAAQMGTLFGVYEFLEDRLHVRWLWPGPLGEVIPPCHTLTVNDWNQTWQPPLVHTRLRTHYGPVTRMAGWADPNAAAAFRRDQVIWLRRQRLCRSISLDYPHAFGDTQFADFINILPDGRRAVDPYYTSAASMCVSDPNFHRQIITDWLAHRSALQPWINCCENDTAGKCTCSRCLSRDVEPPDFSAAAGFPWRNRFHEAATRFADDHADWYKALGSLSDRYCRFYLAVQQQARTVDPNAMVIALSYANYYKPPVDTTLNDHIVISLVPNLMFPWTDAKRQDFRRQWLGWAATGARLYLRPNYTLDGHDFPIFYAQKFGEDFAFAFRHGMIATDFDSLTGQYAAQGPTLYVLARIQAHCDMPVDAILDEYYRGFGPAAQAVAAYFAHWQTVCSDVTDELLAQRARSALGAEPGGWCDFFQSADLVFTPAVIQKGSDLLDRAEQVASGDPAAQQRVAFLRKGLQNAQMTLDTERAWRGYRDNGDMMPFARAVTELDAFRASVEKDDVANMGYLAWAESRSWDRTAAKALLQQHGVPLPDAWTFMWDPNDRGLSEHWFAADYDDRAWLGIDVNGPWEKQDAGKQWKSRHGTDYDGIAWYRNRFTVALPAKADHLILQFGAVDEACTVWLNGTKLLEAAVPVSGRPRFLGKTVRHGYHRRCPIRCPQCAGRSRGGPHGHRRDMETGFSREKQQL